jgi:hypothetical protein
VAALTNWDVLEASALAILCLYAWNSPVRFNACSTLFAVLVFHSLSRIYIGYFGPGVDGVFATGVVASFIAAGHLAFNYTSKGLATGVLFALITIAAGFTVQGSIPIRLQQGPGLWDFWTMASGSMWAIEAIVASAVWRARRVSVHH